MAARGAIMDTKRIVAELRAERDKIAAAISALEAVNFAPSGRADRPPRAAAARSRRGRMSAAARRKLSRLLKQRWAQGKMRPGAKAKPALAAKPARRLSRAGRERIAAAQRARWAKQRAQQPTQTAAA
jgi:hypothetical protein